MYKHIWEQQKAQLKALHTSNKVYHIYDIYTYIYIRKVLSYIPPSFIPSCLTLSPLPQTGSNLFVSLSPPHPSKKETTCTYIHIIYIYKRPVLSSIHPSSLLFTRFFICVPVYSPYLRRCHPCAVSCQLGKKRRLRRLG